MVDIKDYLKKIYGETKDFAYGMAVYDMARSTRKTQAQLEDLFLLITFGDMLGVPILPPYYTLRILPYTVDSIDLWKKRLLREKEITDIL